MLDLVKAKFMVDDNFPKHVFFASASDPNGVFNWNISERLKTITKPTQIYAGREDQATTVEVNQFLADRIPNAQIKVLDDVVTSISSKNRPTLTPTCAFSEAGRGLSDRRPGLLSRWWGSGSALPHTRVFSPHDLPQRLVFAHRLVYCPSQHPMAQEAA